MKGIVSVPSYLRECRTARRLTVRLREQAAGVSVWGWAGEAGRICLVALPQCFVDGQPSSVGEVARTVALVAAVLPLRRLFPAAVLLGCSVLTTWSVLSFAVPALAYGAARRLSGGERSHWWRGSPALLGSTTLCALGLAAVRNASGAGLTLPVLLTQAVGTTLLFLVVPALCGVLVGQRQRLVRTLRERNHHLERARRLAESRARLQERERIAGEMHDLLGHRLTLITLYAGAMQLVADKEAPRLEAEASVIASTARAATGELRDLLGVLRTERQEGRGVNADDAETAAVEGAHGDAVGTEEDIGALVDASRYAGLKVRLTWTPEGAFIGSTMTRRALHRVVREALTNAHRHAPATPGVEVCVQMDTTSLLVTVTNRPAVGPASGSGPAVDRGGNGSGLLSLRERVLALGGTFDAGPTADEGFTLRARLPLSAASATDPTDDIGAGQHGSAPFLADGSPVARSPRPRRLTWLRKPGRGSRPGGGGVTDRADGPAAAGRRGKSGGGGPTSAEDPVSARRYRRLRRSGCAVLVMALLAGLGATGLWIWTVREESEANTDRYARVRPGMARPEVERILGPEPGRDVRDELRAGEPARKQGTECLYRMGQRHARVVSYRFCFRAGRLVEKRSYEPSAEDD